MQSSVIASCVEQVFDVYLHGIDQVRGCRFALIVVCLEGSGVNETGKKSNITLDIPIATASHRLWPNESTWQVRVHGYLGYAQHKIVFLAYPRDHTGAPPRLD
jgi:hypothetical protein